MPVPLTSFPVRTWRWLRLGVHVAFGLWVAARFRKQSQQQRAQEIQNWSLALLKLLNIEVKVSGVTPGQHPPNTLLIANHISWLDIFALNCVTVAHYVAKSDILSWPFIGWLVKSAGTLFIDRHNRRDTSRINQHLARALENGNCMAVFPESTTTEGDVLLPFKASLFESVLLSKGTVQPVALRYLDAEGQFTTAAAYAGDTTFMQSLASMFTQPKMTVELTFLPSLHALDFETRFALSEAAREVVANELKLVPAPAGTAQKTPVDLPA
jgi:1-acyl-sn-glycerol-3-phosphate acyltransferase